jgi:3-isopropylmalate dehydrogenase
MRSYSIGVIPGDGIGPEVVREAIKVLDATASVGGFGLNYVHYPYGAQHYLDTGELLPEDSLDRFRSHHAILLGAIGDPRVQPGVLERSILLAIRFGLDLYVNLRPVVLYSEHLCPIKGKKPEDVNFVVVRENTEDVYAGGGGILKRGTPHEVAIAEMIFTRHGVERVVRYAFELARRRNGKKRVTLVDKANVILAHDLWTRTFAEVGEEYPDIEKDHAYVDACTMWFVKNPEWFDVIVTTNMFGDIITDLGAMIQGGMGIAASGNIHPGRVSMFEPIHGSSPKYAGKNVANPLGTIAAASMMLDFIGETRGHQLIESAISRLLSSGRIPSVDARSGLSTSQIGDMVSDEVLRLANP